MKQPAQGGGFISVEVPSDLDLTEGPETGRGQGVTTETHSHLTALRHRRRQTPAGCPVAKQSLEEEPGRIVIADIKFVCSLDTEACGRT